MKIRTKGKTKTLFIYPGSHNPYISVKGIKGEQGPDDRLPENPLRSRKSLTGEQELSKYLSEKHLSPKQLKEQRQPTANYGSIDGAVAPRRIRKKLYTHSERNEELAQLREENKQLQARVDSLELYFSKIGLVGAETQQDHDNLSLKVLLQQQKISSLVYMIKQYRSGNRTESSLLERKLAEFEPQLEKDLTDKLAEVNKELERAQHELDRMRVMYEKCAQGDGSRLSWDRLLNEVTETQRKNEQLSLQNALLEEQLQEAYVSQQTLAERDQQLSRHRLQIERLSAINRDLEQELVVVRTELELYRRKAEEAEYELSEKRSLEVQLRDRNQVVHETAKQLARAQNENFAVRGRLEGLLKNFNQKIFQETSIIEKLGRYFSDVTENRCKLADCLSSLTERLQRGQTAELATYIVHLYDRCQELYECVISEFRVQLESLHSEADNSRRVSRNLRLQLDTLNGRFRQEKGELLNPIQKLLKYLAHLREIQAGCEHCETVRSYHEQMKSIMEQMSGSIISTPDR